jgi:hypothetical protein
MRMDRKRNSLRYNFLLVPLLAACGGGGGGGGTVELPPGGLTLPDCGEGSLLTTDNTGSVKCASAPSGQISVPGNCTDNQALNSDGKNLTCVDKANGSGNPLNDKLTTLDKKVEDLTTKATQIKNGGSGSGYLSFKGLSAKTYTGHIKLRGEGDVGVQDNGILAASKICEKDHGAGARICTVGDLFNSAINGKLVRTAPMAETAWIYGHTFANPLNARVAGLSDNCAALSYETADAAWQGTAFQWRLADTPVAGKGDFAPNFYLVGCNTSRKIACCQ